VTAVLQLTALSLKLNFRNRMAILYGYLFPLIFLIAFWTIYRNEPAPLILHLGQLLTVTALGGACFGLPTTIVSERERGVWRRYRLAPVGGWNFILAILLARLFLLFTAALLQLMLGFFLGMPLPVHPAGLMIGFVFTAIAFMGLGMTIAMLVNNVAAVQALGQCIFLPMLMIGGVAVSLESLPRWAQHVSAFFPGRYGVEAMQLCATGRGLSGTGFDLLALSLTGAAGAVAAAGMFRWDQSFKPNKAWLLFAFGMWVVVGAIAEISGRVTIGASSETRIFESAKDFLAAQKSKPVLTLTSWEQVSDADIDQIAFTRLPPDEGIVAPVSRSDEEPDPAILGLLDRIRDSLPGWAPGNVADPVQRARNLLTIAAVPDILEMEQVERFVPRLVFARLQAVIPPHNLPKILYWIAMHPNQGEEQAAHELAPLGLPQIGGPDKSVRGRVMLYAFKLLGRLTGHISPL
jgi:hypothetical protein